VSLVYIFLRSVVYTAGRILFDKHIENVYNNSMKTEIYEHSVLIALNRLKEAGYEAYCVGGCVRDLLMGQTPEDWDIASSALPEEICSVFEEFKLILTGIKHGTVTVLIDDKLLEITTYRIDGNYPDNRHPENVEFTRSLEQDLARRDFTMNAIALSSGGEIIDCFNGRADIKNRVIRCVGDPAERFREDALRILRALRFSAVLGFAIDEVTSQAIFSEAHRLSYISAERIRTELTKLLCGANVGAVLRKYGEVIAVIIPEIAETFGFNQHNRHHCYDVWEHTITVIENTPPQPILRWTAFFHDSGKPGAFKLDENGEGHFKGHGKISREIADAVTQRLKFDNSSRERILTLVEKHDVRMEPDKVFIKRKLSKLGAEAYEQLLAIQLADNKGKSPSYFFEQKRITEVQRLTKEIVEGKECYSLKDLAVNGNDILKLGIKGKTVGDILETLLDTVISGEQPNEREALIGYLRGFTA